jgi:two-component system NarL family sensor kinase
MAQWHRVFFLTVIVLLPLRGMAQPSLSQHQNDSAFVFLEQGKLEMAHASVTRALTEKSSIAEQARSYSLLGMVKEEEGYLTQALQAYRTSMSLARRSRQQKILASSLNGLASIGVTTGKYDSVMSFLNQSLELDTTTRNKIKTLQVEGEYWKSQNQYDKGLAILQQALNLANRVNDKKVIAVILSSIGSIYFSHNPDMKQAIDFYQRSIAAGDSVEQATVIVRNYGRLANAYMVTGDLLRAESYLIRARKIIHTTENKTLQAYILSSWSILLSEQGKIKEAAEFAEEPIRIKRALGQQRQLQNDLLNIADFYMVLKQYNKADRALSEGTAISHSLHDVVYLKYFYNMQSMLDSAQGDYKAAYRNLKRAIVYKDSTFSVDHLRAVNEVKEKYESEQKEKMIAEKELEIEQQKYKQAILLGAAGITILLLVVILIVIRNRSKARFQEEKNRQHQLRLHTIVQTQEDVQQRIARDLHDGLVQVLGAAKMSLESAGPKSDTETLQKHIRKASDIMDEAVTEARSISHQILPYSLLKGGLIPALDELSERSLADCVVEKSFDLIDIADNKAINIYRIVQELANNVQKHSGATGIKITLRKATDEIHLIFEDNGKGYTSSTSSQGAGLSNMITRAELMGGSITFRSEISKGSHAHLIVPL